MSTREIIKNYGASIQQKLLNYSRTNNKNNREVLIKYLHNRFLYRMSISKYARNFILKGSALIYVYLLNDARNTKDVDFMGKDITPDKLKMIIKDISTIVCEEDGVIFLPETVSVDKTDKHNGYDDYRVSIKCKLGTAQEMVKMDISFNEVITPSSIKLKYPELISGLPEIVLNTYTLETLIAEKIQAIVEKGVMNTRMKDFYDIYYILNNGTKHIRYDILKTAIKNTFNHRHTKLDKNNIVFDISFYVAVDRADLWHRFLVKNKLQNISFYEVGLFICRAIPPLLQS